MGFRLHLVLVMQRSVLLGSPLASSLVVLASACLRSVCVCLCRFFSMGQVLKQVDETEHRLIKNMLKEKVPWSTVQKSTSRSPEAIRSNSGSKATKPKVVKDTVG